MKKSGKGKKNVKISACMMVKNEEEMLPRCLNSIKHLVDEIIVVDTGSSDKTVEIARSFGAKIYHHPWENDFSKHRNQSISYATGDWFLIIDADEELDAYDLKKKDLKNSLSKAPKGLHCFLIKVLDKNREGKIVSASGSARIFRNNVGVEYRGIVHNTARYSGSVGSLDLRLFHYGYALSEEQMQAKYKRTSGLLLKRIEKDPLDSAAYYYLFQVYMEMKEYQQAIGYAKLCFEILNRGGESGVDPSFYYPLYHGVANAYIKTQLFEKAETMARRGLEIIPDEVDLFYDLAAVGYFTNNPDLMIEGGQNYLRVVDDFRTNASRVGTRFVFTTSKDAELTVSFWLMLAYILGDRLNDFSDLWEKTKEQIVGKIFFQKKLFSILEEKEALGTLAKIGSYLLSRIEAIPVEGRREVLSRLMFVIRDKISRQNSKDIKNDRHLETVVTQYLDMVESYDTISYDDAIILSEFLLEKNMGKFFLDLTLSLFERELSGKIKTLDTDEAVAAGYDLIAKKQKKNRKGRLLSLLCLNIAWNLTEDKQYLVCLEGLGQNSDALTQADIVTKKNPASSIPSRESLSIEPKGFKAAFREADITPIVSEINPVQRQGLTKKERTASSVSSPLKLQMLLIEDKNQTKLFFVTADIIGFDSSSANQIKKVGELWGIGPEGIILNASNTNHAPGTVSHISECFGKYDKDYSQKITNIITQELTMLHGALEDSELYVGSTDTCIGASKRIKNNGAIRSGRKGYDTHTPFLILDINKKANRVALINHGCLPTILDTNHSLSADFPGYFRNELTHSGNIDNVMFLQGAAGDTKETSKAGNDLVFAETELDAKANGILLADAINKALESELVPLNESIISYSRKTMHLPLKKFPDISRIKQLKDDPNNAPNVREWASRIVSNFPAGNFPNAFTLDIQIVSIGKNATFICFPATPAAELGKKLKQMIDSPKIAFILGNTNGLGYLPDEEIIDLPEYEQETYPYFHMMPYLYAKGIENEITAKTQQCLDEINDSSESSPPKKYEEKASMWDFIRFKHQRFPEYNLNSDYFKKSSPVASLINQKTAISSMGSCFARNIAIFLQKNGYNYLVTELPYVQASAHWDQVFNTACMRQIFEYSFNGKWNPVVRWWPKDDMVQDPFRRQILYDKKTCEADFERHRQASYKALSTARVIIVTLGLVETWRDRRDKMTFYQVPSPKIYDPEIHEFYLQTPQDCITDLERIHTLFKQNNPDASIIITVSPVPLIATFRKGVDPVTANGYSKATLRVAAEVFANTNENVYYFPSYEIITSAMKNPYEQDDRHVTQDAIKEMMEIFKTWFMAF